ncbi:MAG TPA: hypothetical protein VID29_02790 [Solirubrobacteraceae bacterium]
MDLDRPSIEKRDFPIARKGYEPAAVDAHLRALATDVQGLVDTLAARGAGASVGSAAATQVQSILEAAETTAADIERQASDAARRAREDAERDAAQTRAQAVAHAQAHVQAVSQATAVLLERVQSMDGEVGALLASLRAGAERLAMDLGAVERDMGELYDAASGRAGPAPDDDAGVVAELERLSAPAAADVEPSGAPGGAVEAAPPAAALGGTVEVPAPSGARGEAGEVSPAPAPGAVGLPDIAEPAPAPAAVGPPDVDGARLIALNMALNGEPREHADRYLAENFELSDRAKLLDEVYAAIEG